MIKPGYTTTEFWTTLTGQLLALLTILGILHGGDAATLQDALSKCIAAVFVLASNAWIVVRYIQSRTELKQATAQTSAPSSAVVLPWVTLAVIGGLVAPAWAGSPLEAPPARTPTCLIRIDRRQPPRDDTALMALMQQMIGLQQQSLANQQAILALLQQQRQTTPPHAATPIIIQHHYAQPLQELPIAGRPKQELPIEGRPKQDLPIAGPPRQELPEQGRPRQDLPEQGRPRQELPDVTRPKQELPSMPPATTGRPLPMQRYTVVRTLWLK